MTKYFAFTLKTQLNHITYAQQHKNEIHRFEFFIVFTF
jgi:hypothetical protein